MVLHNMFLKCLIQICLNWALSEWQSYYSQLKRSRAKDIRARQKPIMFVAVFASANLGSRMSLKGVELTAWRHIYFTLTHYLICLCSDHGKHTERGTSPSWFLYLVVILSQDRAFVSSTQTSDFYPFIRNIKYI